MAKRTFKLMLRAREEYPVQVSNRVRGGIGIEIAHDYRNNPFPILYRVPNLFRANG